MEPIFIIVGAILLILLIVLILFIISKTKGNIKIQLDKTQFSQGEEVKGRISLTLKKPLEAKALKVGIIGIQRQTRYTGRGTSTSTREVYRFYQDVDGQKIYPAGTNEFPFSLRIPADIISQVNNPVGKAILGTVSALTGGIGGQTKWYISAMLDIKGFNIKKKVQISIY
jgi:hypothetical protein